MSLLRHLTVDITPLKISRDYRLLFFGQLISFFGSMMTFVVIPVQMYQLTGSNFMVGMLYGVEFVPMIILSFIGGALADAVDRRMMLRLTEIGQTVVTAILLANAFLPEPQIWVLFVGVGLHAAFAGLQRPSFEALIQQIMPSELMSAVSALNSIRFSIGFIVSPAIAGLIIVQFGAKVAYSIDFVTFAASLVAVWMLGPAARIADADKPGFEIHHRRIQVCDEPAGTARYIHRRYKRDVLRDAHGAVPGPRDEVRRKYGRAVLFGDGFRTACCEPHLRMDQKD